MDYRCLSYVTFMGSQGDCQSHSNTSSSWKNQWKTTTKDSIFTKIACSQLTSEWTSFKEYKSSLTIARDQTVWLHNLLCKLSQEFSKKKEYNLYN